MNLILEIRLVPKEVGKLLLQSIFAFPRSFFYSVSAPLNSAYPYFGVSGPHGIAGLAADLSSQLARVLLRVPSNTFLIVRRETLGVYLTFLLVAPDGMLRLPLSSELGTVQCTERPIFLVLEISGFPE